MSAGVPNFALPSPYRGIEPFRYVDRDNYFGQLRGTQELFAKTLLYRLVVFFGESGAGKSSLLNAALIPALQKEGVQAERLRIRPDAERPISVERLPISERNDTDFLPSIFADDAAHAPKERIISCSLESFLPTVRAKAGEARPLLIFDQFEEIFTLFEHNGADAASAKTLQRSILDALFLIVSDQSLQAKVIIVIREDFLGKLEILARRYPQVLDHRVRLPYFNRDDANEAILGAFRHEGRFPSCLTADLAREIVQDLSSGAQDALVSPTQVQIICSRLWDSFSAEQAEIGLAEYRKLEGATGIVKGFFESELQKVDRGLQSLAITILGNLITGSDTRDVVSEEKLRGLIGQYATRAEDVSSTLGILEARRLISKTSQRGTYFYEVSSEYLISPIQKQSRKLAIEQAAAEAERKAAEEASEKAREASQGYELERAQAIAVEQKSRADAKAKSARRLRLTALGLAAALLLAMVATVWALGSRKSAERSAQAAQQAEQLAERNNAEALAFAKNTSTYALIAQGQYEQLAKQAHDQGNTTMAQYYATQAVEAKATASRAMRPASEAVPKGQAMSGVSTQQAGGVPKTPIKHLIVLMMENRSFDHMLGGLKEKDPRIDGLIGNESNPDAAGNLVRVAPSAAFQGQLDPDPAHSFPAVASQIFGDDVGPRRIARMNGFVKSYYNQQRDVARAKMIMYYFKVEKLPILTSLATEFAVCDRWFSSVPGPTVPNRAFAQYGTSFGQVGMDIFFAKGPYRSIFERMITSGRTAKIYYQGAPSVTMENVALLKNSPQIFSTFDQFLADSRSGTLPDYSFVEPNYNDQSGENGEILATDQHPDHNVQSGESFIAAVYNAIRNNETQWRESLLVITYSNHGGLYDHVPPPASTPDGFVASAEQTGTGEPFAFDRLGLRVPAVIVSPYIPRGTVDHTLYDHASIPATVSKLFLKGSQVISPRERNANTLENNLTLAAPRKDTPIFKIQ